LEKQYLKPWNNGMAHEAMIKSTDTLSGAFQHCWTGKNNVQREKTMGKGWGRLEAGSEDESPRAAAPFVRDL
jgi:hypothetical protein